MKTYEHPVCRGSYALGTACGRCMRCADERAKVETIMPGVTAPALTVVNAGAVAGHKTAEVDFVAERESVAIYRFDDGSVLKAKSVLMHVERIEGAYSPDGSPMYNCLWNQVMTVIAPDHLKRKP